MKKYFILALKNIKRRGLRSWLTVLGIVIGIAAVISLISLGDALKTAVNSQFGISTTEVITIQAGGLNYYGAPGSAVAKPLTIDDAESLETIKSVEVVIPRNIETLKMDFNNNMIIGYAASIIEGEKRQYIYDIMKLETEEGRLLRDEDYYNVVVGYNFLDGEKNGFGKGIQVGNKILIQGQKFEVVGILKKKGSFIIDNAVLINDKPLREITGKKEEVDIIAVKVKSKDLMDEAKKNIEKVLRKRRNVKEGEEDFKVSTPEATLQTVNQVLSGVQAFILIIAFASILIGAVGIINTMTTSVLERKKEIGIMKSVGARNSDIFLQFLIESGMIGMVGGAIGIVISSLTGFVGINALNNYLGAEIPLKINFLLIFSALLGGFLIGAFSGIIPAMQAAKQNPVEALRD